MISEIRKLSENEPDIANMQGKFVYFVLADRYPQDKKIEILLLNKIVIWKTVATNANFIIKILLIIRTIFYPGEMPIFISSPIY